MTRKQDRLSNRAARYRGERRFPRVVPEIGLLRILGWAERPARPKKDAAVAASEHETEQTATAGK